MTATPMLERHVAWASVNLPSSSCSAAFEGCQLAPRYQRLKRTVLKRPRQVSCFLFIGDNDDPLFNMRALLHSGGRLSHGQPQKDPAAAPGDCRNIHTASVLVPARRATRQIHVESRRILGTPGRLDEYCTIQRADDAA